MRIKPWLTLAVCSACCFAPAPAQAAMIDLTGDTFGSGAIQHDITTYTADYSVAGQITFTVNFAGAISAPSLGLPTSVIGFIDIDTDQNAATGGDAPWGGAVPGGNNWINRGIDLGNVPGPTINLGDEFYIDLQTEGLNPGFVDIVRTSDNTTVGTSAIAFGASSFTTTVSLALLGGDDGLLNYGLLLGTFDEPTDRAPNGSTPATSEAAVPNVVPEPSSLVLIATGVGSLLAYGRRRRRQAASAYGVVS
jgi:hypothetical protein